jgi:hypothetical protein
MLALFHPSLATEHLDCLHLLISSHPILLHVISCHLVSFHRELFLNPAPGYDPYSDPLSIEGCSRPSATSCGATVESDSESESESGSYYYSDSGSDSDSQSESDSEEVLGNQKCDETPVRSTSPSSDTAVADVTIVETQSTCPLTSVDQGDPCISLTCMPASVIEQIRNGYKDGQHSCLLQGLQRTCTGILKSFLEASSPVHNAAPAGFGTGSGAGGSSSRAPSTAAFSTEQSDSNSNTSCKVWISLCLYKLVEQFAYAKYLVFTEVWHKSHSRLTVLYHITY